MKMEIQLEKKIQQQALLQAQLQVHLVRILIDQRIPNIHLMDLKWAEIQEYKVTVL
jgi:hypothetical protein